jgi:hypothetical protein
MNGIAGRREQVRARQACRLPTAARPVPRDERRVPFEERHGVTGRIARCVDRERTEVAIGNVRGEPAEVELAIEHVRHRRAVQQRRDTGRRTGSHQEAGQELRAVARQRGEVGAIDFRDRHPPPPAKQTRDAATEIVGVDRERAALMAPADVPHSTGNGMRPRRPRMAAIARNAPT